MMRIRSCLFIMLAAVISISAIPAGVYAASVPSLEDTVVYHTPQSDYKSGDCLLTANKFLIRRAAVSKGSLKWTSITNKSLRKSATVNGNTSSVKNAYTYTMDGVEYKIGSGKLTGDSKDAKLAMLAGLLNKYPYGVVVWGKSASETGAHAVLAVKVKNTTIYAIDPTNNRDGNSAGIQKWKYTTMKSISNCTKYWVISGTSGKSSSKKRGSAKSALKATDVTYPETLNEGSTFGVNGYVESNYKIRSITISILNSKGKKVISQTAKPNSWDFSLDWLDHLIKFGTLAPGKYTYKISATDEKTSKVLHKNKFRVVKGVSELRITSVKAPKTIEEGSSFSIKGVVRSNYKLKYVKVYVKDSNGKIKISAKANPDAKVYNIYKLDEKIKFGTLKKGKYTYYVRAADTKKAKTLVKRKFSVI